MVTSVSQEQAEHDALKSMQTNSNQTVAELSIFHRIILIFLPHLESNYARSLVKTVESQADGILKLNCLPVFVITGSSVEEGENFFQHEMNSALVENFLRVHDCNASSRKVFEQSQMHQYSQSLPSHRNPFDAAITENELSSYSTVDNWNRAHPIVVIVENQVILHKYYARELNSKPDFVRLVLLIDQMRISAPSSPNQSPVPSPRIMVTQQDSLMIQNSSSNSVSPVSPNSQMQSPRITSPRKHGVIGGTPIAIPQLLTSLVNSMKSFFKPSKKGAHKLQEDEYDKSNDQQASDSNYLDIPARIKKRASMGSAKYLLSLKKGDSFGINGHGYDPVEISQDKSEKDTASLVIPPLATSIPSLVNNNLYEVPLVFSSSVPSPSVLVSRKTTPDKIVRSMSFVKLSDTLKQEKNQNQQQNMNKPLFQSASTKSIDDNGKSEKTPLTPRPAKNKSFFKAAALKIAMPTRQRSHSTSSSIDVNSAENIDDDSPTVDVKPEQKQQQAKADAKKTTSSKKGSTTPGSPVERAKRKLSMFLNHGFSLNVVDVLGSKRLRPFFKLHVTHEHSLENVLYWCEVFKYRKLAQQLQQQRGSGNVQNMQHQSSLIAMEASLHSRAMKIIKTFFDDDSILQINTSNALKKQVMNDLQKIGPHPALFDPIVFDIENGVLNDSFVRFQKSDLWTEMINKCYYKCK